MKHDFGWEIKERIKIECFVLSSSTAFCCHFAAMRKMSFRSSYISAVLSPFSV